MADPFLPELARLAMMLTARQPNRDFMQSIPGGGGNERAPTAFDTMSNAERAAYYSDNPRMAAITQGLQKGFGMTSYGMLQNAMYPDFVREQQAIAQGFPNVEAFSGSRNFGKESSLPAEGVVSPGMPQSKGFFDSLFGSSVNLGTPASVETREATPNPYGPAAADAGIGGSPAQAGGGADNSGDGRTSGGNYGGDAYGGSYQFNQGGMVHSQHLMGRAPAPDDGYGALQGGEYVITKAAVERYGKAMMDAINNGTFR